MHSLKWDDIVGCGRTDPVFHDLLLKDAAKAATELGVKMETELVAVENTVKVHNVSTAGFATQFRNRVELTPVWFFAAGGLHSLLVLPAQFSRIAARREIPRRSSQFMKC